MSLTIVITPPEETQWRIEPRVVAEALARQWPAAEIRWEDDPKYSTAFDFEWDTETYHVVGSFNRKGDCLSLSRTTNEDLAALAIWFRKLVPPSQPLVVWSGSGENCELKPDMTEADFLRDFQ